MENMKIKFEAEVKEAVQFTAKLPTEEIACRKKLDDLQELANSFPDVILKLETAENNVAIITCVPTNAQGLKDFFNRKIGDVVGESWVYVYSPTVVWDDATREYVDSLYETRRKIVRLLPSNI